MADELKVILSMEKRSFVSDAEATRLEMGRVARAVQDTSTELALMRQAAREAGGATKEQTEHFGQMETRLKSLRSELGKVSADYKTLSELPAPKLAAAGPDDSAAYEAHWQKLEAQQKKGDELERSRRANDAVKRTLETPTPETPAERLRKDRARQTKLAEEELHSIQNPKISAGEENAEPGSGGHGGGANRMRNQELGHVLRASFDSLMSGQSPLRVIGQEAPRLLQAFGSSIGSLLKTIGPVGGVAAGAAVAVGAFAIAVSKAHAAAVARSQVLDAAGRPDSSIGGDTQEHARTRVAELEAPIAKARGDDDSSLGFGDLVVKEHRATEPYKRAFAEAVGRIPLVGGGLRTLALHGDGPGNTTGETLTRLQQDQLGRVTHENQVHARDNAIDQKSASQGVDAAVSDHLEREFNERREQIAKLIAANPLLSDTELVKQLREEIDLRGQIAEAQHNQIQAQYALDHRTAMVKLDGNPDGMVDTKAAVWNDEETAKHVHSKALSAAQESVNKANSHVADLNGKGLDTRDAERERDAAHVAQHDAIFNANEALTIAEEQTRQLDLQERGLTKAAQLERTRAEYAEKIRRSEEAGTTELTKQIKAEGEIAGIRAKAEAYREKNDPTTLAKAARQRTKEMQDARHFDDEGRTHDADRDGSAIPNKGWSAGADNAGGTAAAESRDNRPADLAAKHMPRPEHMPGPLHMPDRSFRQPDRQAHAPAPAPAGGQAGAHGGIPADPAVLKLLGDIKDNCSYRGRK